MKKYLKYTIRGFLWLAGIFLLLFLAAYVYLLANKNTIISKVKTEIATKINGDVQIGDIGLTMLQSFPNVSVVIENISVKDTLFHKHKHPFFQARKVFTSISLINVIQKNNPLSGLRIDDGQLYVYTDTSGYTNAYLFSPKKAANSPSQPSKSKNNIDHIRLKNVRLVLNDERKLKLYDFEVKKLNCKMRTNESVITLNVDNNILIHDLAFKTPTGSYAKQTPFEGDFKLVFDQAKKQLSFQDIKIKLKDHPFVLSGQFNFKQQLFNLNISTKRIDYNFARTLLTEKISRVLAMIKLDEKVENVVANLSGPLKGGDPLVKITWKLKGSDVQSPFANLTDCELDGMFINEIVPGLPRKDPNSRLHFQNLSAKFEGIKIASKNVYIDNLKTPKITFDLKSGFNLTQLNNILGSSTIDLQDGKGDVDLTFSGPLQDNSNQNTIINGRVNLVDGLLMYNPRNLQVKNVSVNILFKHTDIYVNGFRGNVAGNRIVMSGNGKNLLSAMTTNPGKAIIDWNIYSPSLNLNNFTNLLKKRAITTATRRKSKLGKTGNQLDDLVNQANFRLDVKADEMLYDNFRATNVNASLGLVNENWILHNVSLQHAGGAMSVKGTLNEINNRTYQAIVKMNMQNVDVNKVLYAFKNFGQDGITYENLRGKVTSDADIKMFIDRELQTPSNLSGYLDFSIKKGALIKYEPLKKLQNIIFKNRNFDEIYFAELKDRIEVNNKDITINRMEIQSTVMTLFVEGVYSLTGKNTDISIQVPLSNLKKRDSSFVPKNIGTDAKAGASVFVRGKPGEDGKIAFKLDIFKKFRKDKKEEDESKADKKKEDKEVKKEEKEEEKKNEKSEEKPEEKKDNKEEVKPAVPEKKEGSQ